MSQILEDAAKGASAGAVLGPVGAAAGGVLGALTDLLPTLATSLFGTKGGAVATAAVQLASAATGKAQPEAADVIGLPPEQQAALRLQLAQLAAQDAAAQRSSELDNLKTQLADVQSARAQTLGLAQAKSALAWGAPVISAIVTLGFFAVLWLTFTQTVPDASKTILNMLVGVLAAAFGSVVSYWIGSSSGSAMKTEHLANSVPANSVTVSRK